MMDEHIRVGHEWPDVKLNTTYSYGLDDQEFVVAFETDYVGRFLDLLMALRHTEASMYTVRDTSVVHVHREEHRRVPGGDRVEERQPLPPPSTVWRLTDCTERTRGQETKNVRSAAEHGGGIPAAPRPQGPAAGRGRAGRRCGACWATRRIAATC